MANNSQPSQGQRNKMAMRTMNFSTRVIYGYILSVILIVLSIIQACTYGGDGNTKYMVYYILLAVFAVGYAGLVTFQMFRGVKSVEKELSKRGEKK